mmetsp:Transcript_34730/g.100015  ORF Transcript_34730/g.100015 Transcript_34730/m.100015 type:complete len:208 (+) Transcript_34730:50-673(+)
MGGWFRFAFTASFPSFQHACQLAIHDMLRVHVSCVCHLPHPSYYVVCGGPLAFLVVLTNGSTAQHSTRQAERAHLTAVHSRCVPTFSVSFDDGVFLVSRAQHSTRAAPRPTDRQTDRQRKHVERVFPFHLLPCMNRIESMSRSECIKNVWLDEFFMPSIHHASCWCVVHVCVCVCVCPARLPGVEKRHKQPCTLCGWERGKGVVWGG